MNASHEPVLHAERFRPEAAPATVCLDIACARGSVTVLTGPSRESTGRWLEAIAALRPTAGRLRILDDTVHGAEPLRHRIGYVDAHAPLLSTFDVRMNVMLPRLYHRREPRADAARTAERLLDRIGYEGPRNEPPARLNALERFQALLARALALEPPLLIIDEPFDIDIAIHWRSLGQRIRALARDDERAVLVATRNLAFAAESADQFVFIDDDCVRVHASWREFSADSRVARFIEQLPFAVEASS